MGLILSLGPVFAGSATWLFTPGNGDWNTAGNWTPGGPPNGAADTATFQSSTVNAVSISTNTEIDGIIFSPGASGFSITASPTFRLTISGSGIANDSGITQNFVAAGNNGKIQFTNNATAGFGTAFSTNGGAVSGGVFGVTEFRDSATAANGTFTTEGGARRGAFGGATQFFDSSTAGNGTFTSNGGAVGAGSGATLFFNSSTAGNANFTTNGSAISGARGGITAFFDSSTAGNGTTFTNNGAAVGGAGSGVTLFFNSSTAGNGTFTNNGGGALLAQGGITQFVDSSSAGRGVFTVNGGAVSGGDGALMQFFNTSTAAKGTFTTNGGAVTGEFGGTTEFSDTSTAGNATFTTNGAAVDFAGSGTTRFRDNSTAGNATFTTNGGASNGAGGGGFTEFIDSSTAGSATFITNGATLRNRFGGSTVFRNSSSAANGTFINNGGGTGFFETSTADNATLIANGGVNGGDGGSIGFGDDSTGGTARVEVFGNGKLDISLRYDPGVTIGSLEGTGRVFLGMNALSVGSNNLSTTFSGVIQDGGINGGTGGSLTKIGTGTLTLSGNNTYTGDTNINGGSLIIDGSIASGNMFVNATGLLGGTGSVGGNVTNAGIVSPGDSPGTLAVNGNYVQASAGTLRIEIAGPAPAEHDLLAIGGSASLGGTLQLLQLNNFTLRRGEKVIFLTAGGGVNGVFATVDNPFTTGTILEAQVVYQPNAVSLELVQGLFAGLGGLTLNQQAVANNLDQVVSDPRGTALIDFLDQEPLGNLPNDFDLIAPEELASIYEISFSQSTVQSINLQRRMDDIRAGSNGFSAAGFAPKVIGKVHGKDSDGKTILEESPAPAFVSSPENRWGIFVTGAGEFVNVGDEDFNARGYDITTGSFTLGVDYRVTSNFAVGLNAGYARSDADLVDGGRVTVDGGKLGLFATYFSGGFYLDGAVGGGWNNYDTRRAALLGDARSETDGGEFNALIGTGYDWKCGGWSFGPTATFQYSYVGINSFTENGSLVPLNFPDQNENSERSTLGLKISHQCKVGPVIIKPELRAAWRHEFGDTAYPIDSRFASGAGSPFTVHGSAIGRDSALIGAGVAAQWNARTSTYLYYDGQLGRSNYDSHNISGGMRISF